MSNDICDLAGKTYKGRMPKPADWYDGRIITVEGWAHIIDHFEGKRYVRVHDSTGRMWETEYLPVKAEIERQSVGD